MLPILPMLPVQPSAANAANDANPANAASAAHNSGLPGKTLTSPPPLFKFGNQLSLNLQKGRTHFCISPIHQSPR